MHFYVFTAQGISYLSKVPSTVMAPEAFHITLSATQTRRKNPILKGFLIQNRTNNSMYIHNCSSLLSKSAHWRAISTI